MNITPEEMEMIRNDKHRTGLYSKYRVERSDGTSRHGQKHAMCEYFVLDLTHDPFAKKALQAYAKACEDEYPILAGDLHQIINGGSPRKIIDLNEKYKLPHA